MHEGVCRGGQKLVVLWVWLGIGLYGLFEYCLRAEMSLKCRQKFPGKERWLPDHLSPFGTSCSSSFNSLPQWLP
jgi:hypothetical protein